MTSKRESKSEREKTFSEELQRIRKESREIKFGKANVCVCTNV